MLSKWVHDPVHGDRASCEQLKSGAKTVYEFKFGAVSVSARGSSTVIVCYGFPFRILFRLSTYQVSLVRFEKVVYFLKLSHKFRLNSVVHLFQKIKSISANELTEECHPNGFLFGSFSDLAHVAGPKRIREEILRRLFESDERALTIWHLLYDTYHGFNCSRNLRTRSRLQLYGAMFALALTHYVYACFSP